MRSLSMWMFLIIATVSPSAAQGTATREEPRPRGPGKLIITPIPKQVPTSLKELCDSSTIIVEGIVQTTLTSRETSPGSLETDVVVAITQRFKGASNHDRIVVAQRGGTLGNLDIRPTQYSIMQPGEHYLLFLIEDKRPNTPAVGLSRYLVTGIWSGLFGFDAEGRMRVSAEVRDSLRQRFEGSTVAQISNAVKETIR